MLCVVLFLTLAIVSCADGYEGGARSIRNTGLELGEGSGGGHGSREDTMKETERGADGREEKLGGQAGREQRPKEVDGQRREGKRGLRRADDNGKYSE